MIYKTDDIHCEILYDGMNFIVEHKKINDDKKSKNYGNVVIDGTRSYFSNTTSMAKHICDISLGKAIERNTKKLEPYLDRVIKDLINEMNKEN